MTADEISTWRTEYGAAMRRHERWANWVLACCLVMVFLGGLGVGVGIYRARLAAVTDRLALAEERIADVEEVAHAHAD